MLIEEKKAEKAGLLWGAYHFGDGTDGAAQAKHFLEKLGSTENIVFALDIEENPGPKNGGTITLTQAENFLRIL